MCIAWADFLPYEVCKRTLCESRAVPVSSIDALLPERIASAVFAGCFCWATIYPADVVRSKMLAYEARFPNETNAPNCSDTFRQIYNTEGVAGFTRGISLTILRAGPVAATVLPIFDYTFSYLEQRRNNP